MAKLQVTKQPDPDEPEVSGELVHLEMELQSHRDETNARLDAMHSDMRSTLADFRSSIVEEIRQQMSSFAQSQLGPTVVAASLGQQHLQGVQGENRVRFGSVNPPILPNQQLREESGSSSTLARSEGSTQMVSRTGGNDFIPNLHRSVHSSDMTDFREVSCGRSLDVNVGSQFDRRESVGRGKEIAGAVGNVVGLDFNAVPYSPRGAGIGLQGPPGFPLTPFGLHNAGPYQTISVEYSTNKSHPHTNPNTNSTFTNPNTNSTFSTTTTTQIGPNTVPGQTQQYTQQNTQYHHQHLNYQNPPRPQTTYQNHGDQNFYQNTNTAHQYQYQNLDPTLPTMRQMRLELAVFSGGDPIEWLNKAEQYYDFYPNLEQTYSLNWDHNTQSQSDLKPSRLKS